MQVRDGEIWLIRGGRLFQQYIVDAYACIEQSKLDYFRFNQDKLRTDIYSGLQDQVRRDGSVLGAAMGRRHILPSSFGGGPRAMHQLYQDAMAIVRELGKPDLFITFTCNPSWEEITRELLNGQTWSDRPDLIARVFQMKINALMDDLKHGVLGKVKGYVWVIEWQKRGLPHAHILLILEERHKIRSIEEINSIVSAEIPNDSTHPEAYQTVTSMMVHGPCNNQCAPMVDGKCSKRLPREYRDETIYEKMGILFIDDEMMGSLFKRKTTASITNGLCCIIYIFAQSIMRT